jgi:hypothetical protein
MARIQQQQATLCLSVTRATSPSRPSPKRPRHKQRLAAGRGPDERTALRHPFPPPPPRPPAA